MSSAAVALLVQTVLSVGNVPNVTVTFATSQPSTDSEIWPVFHHAETIATGNASSALGTRLRPGNPLFDNRSVETMIIVWFSVLLSLSFVAIVILFAIRGYYKNETKSAIDSIHEEFKYTRTFHRDKNSERPTHLVLSPLTVPFSDPEFGDKKDPAPRKAKKGKTKKSSKKKRKSTAGSKQIPPV